MNNNFTLRFWLLVFISIINSTIISAQFEDAKYVSDDIIFSSAIYPLGSFDDFDGDGDLDYVDAYRDEIDSYLMKEDGHYHRVQEIYNGAQFGNYRQRVHTEDYNGDGIVDLWVNGVDQQIEIYMGQGDGTFVFLFSQQNNASHLIAVCGDLNGDNVSDYYNYLSYSGSGVMSVYLSSEDGFVESIYASSAESPDNSTPTLNVIDFDGDGDLDIVDNTTLTGPEIKYLENDGFGNFQDILISVPIWAVVPEFYYNTKVKIENVDDDPECELIVLTPDWDTSLPVLSVFHPFDGTTYVQEVPFPEGSIGLMFADVNGDGYKDAVSSKTVCFNDVGNFESGVVLMDYPASPFPGTSNAVSNVHGTINVWSMNPVGDFNGDGKEDIINLEEGVCSFFLSNGDGSFTPQIRFERLSWLNSNVICKEMNGNDLSDIICFREGEIGAVSGNPEGSLEDFTNFIYEPTFTDVMIYNSVISGDNWSEQFFDGDNDGRKSFYYLTSSLDFKKASLNPLGDILIESIFNIGSYGIQAINKYGLTDFNHDGYPDIFVIGQLANYPFTKYVQVFVSDLESYDAPLSFNEINAPTNFDFVDFDFDGTMDVMISNAMNNAPDGFMQMQLLQVQESGLSVTNFEFFPNMASEGIIKLADFNSDNHVDILFNSQMTGSLELYLNDGDENFQFQFTIDPSSGYYGVLRKSNIIDFDRDGDMDIITNRALSDPISGTPIFGACAYMQGPNGFEVVEIPSLNRDFGSHFIMPIVGDVDNDGSLDIVAFSEGWKWVRGLYNVPYTVQAYAYYDANADGVQQENEQILQTVSAEWNSEIIAQFPNSDGIIQVVLPSEGDYNLHLKYDHNLWALTSPEDSFSFSITSGVDLPIFSIGLTPLAVVDSITLDVVNTYMGCLLATSYIAVVNNVGNTYIDGQVCLELDSLFNVISYSQTPFSISGNTACFEIDSLAPTESVSFQVVAYSPGSNYTGELFTALATFDGYAHIVHNGTPDTLLCAYDPNDLQELTGYEAPLYVNGSDPLEFLIRFQNTGNYFATDITIEDELSELLNWNTFEPVSASHAYTTNINDQGRAVFTFNNIMLPDSSQDFLGSQGYVRFNITPIEGLAIGTTIENTAAIYFDLNEPVITNTVINTIYDCVDLQQASVSATSVCAGEEITCSNNATWIENLTWSFDGNDVGTGNYTHTVNESGTLTMHAANTLCEYTQEFQLTANTANASFTSNGNTLTANDATTYQWFLNGNEIPGATQQTYEITETGNYSVMVVDENGCDGVSEPMNANYTGINIFSRGQLRAFPNPASDVVQVQVPLELFGQDLKVTNALGEVVITIGSIKSEWTRLDCSSLSRGCYNLSVGAKSQLLLVQ
jgi:hypothetical protein